MPAGHDAVVPVSGTGSERTAKGHTADALDGDTDEHLQVRREDDSPKSLPQVNRDPAQEVSRFHFGCSSPGWSWGQSTSR
jgi:hypothetical protein